MTHTEAERILGLLAGGTPGWNSASEETWNIYTDQIGTLRDYDTAHAAVQQIIRSHTDLARPTIAAVFEAYRWEAHRRAMSVPQITGPAGRIVSVREGREIAARAYANACRNRDPETDVHILSGFRTNEPNPDFLDGFLGAR